MDATAVVYRIQAESDRLRADLKKAEGKLKGFQKRSAVISNGIQTAFAGAFAGAAIFQGLKTATTKIAQFEFQLDKVHAVSGATEAQMEKLKKQALELGSTSKFTATQVGELEENLARLGFDTNKILDSTEAITKLAIVADADLGESAKSLAGTLNSFNLEARESERVANVMAESFSKSALDLEKFTVATANSGAVANALGHSLEANTARMGKLVDANIDASKAGTDLRKIYSELNTQGLTYDEAMQKIISSSDKAGTAQKLFGQRAFGAALILAEMQTEVKDLTSELSDSNMELDKMKGIMEDNLLTDFVKLKSGFEGIIQKGEILNPMLRLFVQNITDLLNTINSENLNVWQKFADVYGELLTFGQLDLYDVDEIDKAKKFEEEQKRLKEQTQATVEAFRIWHEAKKNNITSLEQMLKPIKQHVLFDQIKIKLEERHKAAVDARLESIRKQIELTNQATEAAKRYYATGAGVQQIDSSSRMSKNNDASTSLTAPSTEPGDISGIDIAGGALEQHQKVLNKLRLVKDEYGLLYDGFTQEMVDFNQGLSSIINGAMVDTFASIGEAIGSGAGMEGALAGVSSIIASGLQEIGQLMISYGVAELAFQTAVKSLNPFLAIAAGTALVAAGAAIAKGNERFASSVSGGGGGGGRASGSFTGSAKGSQTIKVEFEAPRVEGADLVLALKNQETLDSRATG